MNNDAQQAEDIHKLKYDKDWYFNFPNYWTYSEQINYLRSLSKRIKTNVNNHNTRLLNDAEIKKFWKKVHNDLQKVDNLCILKSGFPQPFKSYLFDIKGVKKHFTYTGNDIIVEVGDEREYFTSASKRDLFIEMMSHDKQTNKVTIAGCTTFQFENNTDTHLEVSINGLSSRLENSGLYSDFKVFGKSIYKKLPFSIEIDLNETPHADINFSVVNDKHSTRVPLKLHFNTRMSKLAGRITYWSFGKYQATHSRTTIHIKKRRPVELFLREVLFTSLIATYWRRPRTAVLRTLYWITKPYYAKQNIWMYADKIYKAGDNAEWLYRYALKQNDNINHYYVLRDDSPDVANFKRDNIPYLSYNTIKQRLLFLNANILVFTHNNAPGYYRFAKPNEVWFRGLFNYDIMYIQHGLTVQETSWLFKKTEDDFRRFFIASKFETDNLLRPAYGFKKSEIIKAGATRYDGLINNDKKNILISPTWRTYLAPPGKDYGESRDASDEFKNSDFYKIYKSLITNKKLIKCAKKNGYSITYLLHPVMSSQINDFDETGYVKVITANDDFNYQKAMTESSLMVTDYSGVQFDFAYMYKPVVYFHPPELPASYDEAVYQYDKHALGDIVTKLDALVDLMCEYMNSGCVIKPEYRKRIDDFFYYHDHKNSKRTYENIVQWQKGAKY